MSKHETETITPEAWFCAHAPGVAKTMDIPRRARAEMLKSASPEFRACLAFGVEMETTSERRTRTGNHQITMSTRHPVSFVRNDSGEIVHVTVHDRLDPL